MEFNQLRCNIPICFDLEIFNFHDKAYLMAFTKWLASEKNLKLADNITFKVYYTTSVTVYVRITKV